MTFVLLLTAPHADAASASTFLDLHLAAIDQVGLDVSASEATSRDFGSWSDLEASLRTRIEEMLQVSGIEIVHRGTPPYDAPRLRVVVDFYRSQDQPCLAAHVAVSLHEHGATQREYPVHGGYIETWGRSWVVLSGDPKSLEALARKRVLGFVEGFLGKRRGARIYLGLETQPLEDSQD